MVNPVNRLVHPSGLKNFADTSVTSNITVGVGEVRESNQVVVLDVGNVLELNDKQRVDAINNFDFARDFDNNHYQVLLDNLHLIFQYHLTNHTPVYLKNQL